MGVVDAPGGQADNGRCGGVRSSATTAQTGLAAVVGLVWANAATGLSPAERRALRLVCWDVCEAHDAASQPQGLTVRADRLPQGAAGAQQLARFLRRTSCSLPASLTISNSIGTTIAAQQL